MTRVPIEPDVAADVLFASDRTCCVCRMPGKRTQIHHIDEDHANSSISNLAVLCLDCHDQTQIRGGFARRLDAEQVQRYKSDWEQRIRRRRDDADQLAMEVMSGLLKEAANQNARAAVVEGVGAIEARSSAKAVGESVPLSDIPLSDYIRTLPELRRRAYAEARPEWESGVTGRMVDASYRVLDVLQEVLVCLASYYPVGHFGHESPRDYISELVASRFRWHWYRHEPHGPGRDGTIVQTLVAGSVVADLEQMILEMVGSLTLDWSEKDSAAFDLWSDDWRKGEYIDPVGLRKRLDQSPR